MRSLSWDRGRPARIAGKMPAVRLSINVALLVLVVLLALTACGKRNAPEAPPDVPNTFPRPYPSE